jgi:endonuclease YncB( thermonuclease family)
MIWLMLALAVLVYRQGWLTRGRKPQQPAASAQKVLKAFEVITGAQWMESRENDGDSFWLHLPSGEEKQFRLYFADCPEKRRHQYNGQRLEEQGRYFGGLDEAATIEVGIQAGALTEKWMSTSRFTLYTKWQPVFDHRRHYAFILFEDGEDLSAKLVRAGLARIHTAGSALPDGTSEAVYKKRLKELEAQSRQQRLGGWQ